MSALFDAIVAIVDDCKPDRFDFSVKEVPVETWNRICIDDTKKQETQARQTTQTFAYTWTWTQSKIAVSIRTRIPAQHDAETDTYTLFASHDSVTVICCGNIVEPPNQGPKVHAISYSIKARTQPEGITSLLRAIQRGVVNA